MKTIIIPLLLMATTCHGQSIDQVRAEIHRQGLPHAHIVLAQARLETGNFRSERCRRDKNLFGIKHNGKYARYRTWQDSIKDYKQRISSRYKGGDYLAFLKRIGYAKDPAYQDKVRKIARTSK